jgi:hypothetical protein
MSKGLEALNELCAHINAEDMGDETYFFNGNDERDYKIIEKELRALEIIVTKKVNLYGDDLYANGVYGLNYYSTYEHYKASCEKLRYKKKSILTEEEFKLLKEVLK